MYYIILSRCGHEPHRMQVLLADVPIKGAGSRPVNASRTMRQQGSVFEQTCLSLISQVRTEAQALSLQVSTNFNALRYVNSHEHFLRLSPLLTTEFPFIGTVQHSSYPPFHYECGCISLKYLCQTWIYMHKCNFSCQKINGWMTNCRRACLIP